MRDREWFVRLKGDEIELSILAESIRMPRASISVETNGTMLRSELFADLPHAETVRVKADELVRILSGACRMELDSQRTIEVDCVFRSRLDGGFDAFVSLVAVAHARALPVSLVYTHANGTVEKHHPGDLMATWLDLALNDPAVAKVLRLFDVPRLDFVSLYRIFEVIEHDAGPGGIEANQWATGKAVTRFTRTVNSPGAVGDEARHGKETTVPPARPMLLPEAGALVRSITYSWLAAKVSG